MSLFQKFWLVRSSITLARIAAAAAIAIGIATTGCTARSGGDGKTLEVGNGAEPKDLDPHITTGVPESHILQNLFEALVSKDAKTLDPVPGVAESWTISKDGRVYTFKLRENSKWSDGSPLTAIDFVYSWTRLLEPKTAAEYAYQAYYVKNGKAYNEGKLKDASQLGLKAIDARTFQVTLEQPTPFFLSLLFHHSLYPVPQKAIEAHKEKWTRPENFVSNGAFKLEKWEMNKVISVVKNPNYWDAATTTLDRVNFWPIEKADTEEKMFRSGKLHVTDTVPLEKISHWQADKSGVYNQHPYLGVYYYWFNVTKKPFDDKRIRQALALAIDRTRIVKYVTRAGQIPATFFTPPGTGGYNPKPRLPADLSQLDKAKKLLADAGYPNGKGMPPVEVLFNTQDGHKKIAEAIQQMWKENLGIEVTLVNQEWKVYLDTLRTKSYQAARAGWIGDYNDPNTFLDMFVTGNGNNRCGFANKAYDALLDEATKEQDVAKRLAIFDKAEAILMEEMPVMPIYIYTRTFLKQPEVTGWFANVEGMHQMKFVRLATKSVQ